MLSVATLHVAIMTSKNTVCIVTARYGKVLECKGTTYHSAPLRHQHVCASSLHSIIIECVKRGTWNGMDSWNGPVKWTRGMDSWNG